MQKGQRVGSTTVEITILDQPWSDFFDAVPFASRGDCLDLGVVTRVKAKHRRTLSRHGHINISVCVWFDVCVFSGGTRPIAPISPEMISELTRRGINS